MANASIVDFGNEQGLLYITEIDGTTFINAEIDNNQAGVDEVKRDALNRAPVGGQVNPFATFEVELVTVAGNLTTLNINGINQLSSTPTLDSPEEDSATEIAASINAHTPATGPNYTASSSGKIVYIYPAENVGSSLNGQVVTETHTGTATLNYTNIDGGQDGNEEYSQINGRRYWMDADYGATGCSGAGTALPGDLTNAIEITPYVIKRGAEGGIPIYDQTVDANLKLVDYVRLENIQQISVRMGAPTTLEFIPTNTAVLGDVLVMYSTGSTITFEDLTVATQGNIMLSQQTSYPSDGEEEAIAFRLVNDSVNGMVWAEMWRSIPAIGAGLVGTTELAALSVTTGKMALLAVDSTILDDDAVTTVKILDLNVTEAKLADLSVTNGKLGLLSVDTPQLALLSVDSSILDDDAVETAKILDGNVTVAKLESSLQKELIVVPVSFEEAGVMGLIKVTIPYACDVTAIDAAVTKLIEASDDATIIPKNHAGTAMTSGQIDLTAASPLGNIFSSAPTANNSFVAGEVLSLESAKATVGGISLVSVELTRT